MECLDRREGERWQAEGGEVVATVQQMFSYWANSDLLPANYDFVWQIVFSLDDGTGDRRS